MNWQKQKKFVWLSRLFGDKKFVWFYWKLTLPGIFYGIVYAAGPFLALVLARQVANNQDDANVTALLTISSRGIFIQTFGIHITSIIVAASMPAIAGRQSKHAQDLHSMVRTVFYMGFLFSFLIVLIVQFIAEKMAISLLAARNIAIENLFPDSVIQYMTFYSQIIIFNSFFSFFDYYYKHFFFSAKYTRDLMYAYVFRLLFMVIAFPVFIKYSSHLPLYDRVLGYALLNVFEQVILSLYLFIFTHMPIIYRIRFFNKKLFYATKKSEYQQVSDFQRDVYVYQLVYKNPIFTIYKEQNRMYVYAFFRTGLNISYASLREIWFLGWATFIDRILLIIITFAFYAFSLNINTLTWRDYNTAILTTLNVRRYTYGFFQATSTVLPTALVTYELGRNNIAQAKQNAMRLFAWGHLLALVLGAFFVAAFVNLPYVFNKNANQQIINLAIILVLIYSVSEGFSAAYRVVFYLLWAGGNRFVMLASSIVNILRTIIIFFVFAYPIQTGNLWADGTYNQYILYYFVLQSSTIIRYLVTLMLFFWTKWTYNASQMKPSNWFKTIMHFVAIICRRLFARR